MLYNSECNEFTFFNAISNLIGRTHASIQSVQEFRRDFSGISGSNLDKKTKKAEITHSQAASVSPRDDARKLKATKQNNSNNKPRINAISHFNALNKKV